MGYRYFEKEQIPVSFPFGFGLSYTTFTYSGLEVEENGIRLRLKMWRDCRKRNRTDVCGASGQKNRTSGEKSSRDLQKFIWKQGEEKEVCILFDDKTFRVFDEEAGMWVEEAGTYRIFVGSSSQDIHLAGEIFQTGLQKTGSTFWKSRGVKHRSGRQSAGMQNVWDGEKIPEIRFGMDIRFCKQMIRCRICDMRKSSRKVYCKMLKNKIEKAEENGADARLKYTISI